MEYKHDMDRIYAVNADGKTIAEILFPMESDGYRCITHTIVDGSLRGQGVAGKLVKAAADQIREEGRKTRASCSYAVKWFQKHPEYNDILVK